MLTVLTLCTLLVSTAAQIKSDTPNRVYSITIGHDYGAQEYVNEMGYLVGFAHDVIDAVCAESAIDCRIVFDLRDDVCWINNPGEHPSGGKGLHARWFDGCSGYDATVERIHTFAFSAPFTTILKSYFYYKRGTGFDERNLSGKTIGIIRGWASNEKCVARQSQITNGILDKDHVKAYGPTIDLLNALDTGEVNAAFADEFTFTADIIRDKLSFQSSRPYNCLLSGNSIMMRKDSSFVEHWNMGFHKLKNTRRFQQLCDAGENKHGHRGPLNCNL